jgi:uncharacterized protein
MPRPRKCRWIGCKPNSYYFKPRGIPMMLLEEINLTLDEFEAIRLADLDGLYQEEASQKMKISRPTFTRLIESAHKKIAEAIVKAKALKIDGGVYKMLGMKKFKCSDCNFELELPHGTAKPSECPQCKSSNLHRHPEDRGHSRGGGRRQGRCGRKQG